MLPTFTLLSLETYATIVRLDRAHETSDATDRTLATLALRYERAPKGDNVTETVRPQAK